MAAALLVIAAGVVKGEAAYVLWAVALAVQVLSPPVIRVRGRFAIQPAHFTERHGALVIIVLGESVVDIGIGAEGHPVTVSLALSAVLGLALTAYFYAYIPILLGIVALAADPDRGGRAGHRAAGGSVGLGGTGGRPPLSQH